MKAEEAIGFLEGIAPPESGVKGDQNRILYGNQDAEINGIGVAWMATIPVIKAAAGMNINLLVVHERLFFPYQESDWYQDIREDKKEVNMKKKRLLDENSIVVYRTHSNWDALKGHGVVDSIASRLGYERVVGQTKFIKTYEVPERALNEIAGDVKSRLGLDFVKVYGSPDAKISRITPLIGGFGGNQLNMPELAQRHGSQLVILGDSVEYTVIHAQELGLNVIETMHSVSETPGVMNQYKLLKERFPDVPVHYFDSGSRFFRGFEPRIV